MTCSSFLSSCRLPMPLVFFFFFNDTATTEIYTLSLHDALPISATSRPVTSTGHCAIHQIQPICGRRPVAFPTRSEEHTSELQSQSNLVCRLLLEKKKKTKTSAQTLSKARGLASYMRAYVDVTSD